MNKYFIIPFALNILAFSVSVTGQSTNSNLTGLNTKTVNIDDKKIYFNAELGLGLSEVENANRTSRKDDEIDEIQTRTEFSFAGAYYGDMISEARAEYQIFHDKFDKNSQDDDSSIVGDSNILFGGESTFFDLGASHSSRIFLISPEAANITSNQDDRNITTLFGALRTAPGRSNIFSLGGDFTSVSYQEFDINDSSRDVIYLGYTRNVNEITTAGLTLSSSNTDFDFNDAVDYQYKRATLFMSRTLRRLSYSVFLGQYFFESTGSNDEDDGVYGQIDIDYDTGTINFFAHAERDVTDTSLGNNNDTFSSAASVNGSISEQDQILRKYVRVGMAFGLLCDNCNFQIDAGREDELYFNLANESSTSNFISVLASYDPLKSLTLAVNARYSDFSYTMREDPNDYDYVVLRASANFTKLSRNLSTEIFLESLKREFKIDGGYESYSLGLNIKYQIY